MKSILILLLLAIPFISSAQKTKVDYDDKTHQVTVDGTHAFNIERIDCGFGMVDCHFDVFDKEGNRAFRINYRSFNSPVEVNASNPEGTVRYFEFIFLESKQKAEVKFVGISEKNMAKFIVSNNLMVDGHLDPKAVDEFVLTHGTPFAERVKF